MPAGDSADIQGSLRKNFLFASLTDEELARFSKQVRVENLSAGTMIVQENQKADSLFVVVSGGVNVMKSNGHFLAYLGPGGFFGEMGLFMEYSVRSANCIAAADSCFVVVSKEVLDEYCKDHPSTGLKIFGNIIRTLAERLQATSSDLATIMGAQVKSQPGVAKMVEEAQNRKSKSKK